MERQKQMVSVFKADNCCTTLAGIAHDYNNVIAGILGNVELAKLKLSNTDDSYKYLTKVEEGTEEAKRITEFLFRYSMGYTNVNEYVSLINVLKGKRRLFHQGSNINLVYDLPEGELTLKGSTDELRMVFRNILLNSKQAMNDRGTVWISVSVINLPGGNPYGLTSGEYAKITFEDDGKGISEERANKVFNPGYTTKTHGKGLGLSICKSIIEKHRGHIELCSERSKGAKFVIFLPIDSDDHI